MQTLTIGDGADWSFVGGAWQDGKDQLQCPSDLFSLRMAIHKQIVYRNVAVECDFQPQYAANGGGDGGLVIRAQGARHYYWVHHPWCGQTTRAKHFWLAISKFGETGWRHSLRFEVVPGVPSEMDRWYRLRVEAQGALIRTWIDGHPGPSVSDDSYDAGAVGVAGYGGFQIRDLQVSGEVKSNASWEAGPDPKIDWFHVLGDGPGAGERQKPLCLRSLADGTLLLQYSTRDEPGCWVSRSQDRGLTWDEAAPMPRQLQGYLHVTGDGRLLTWQFDEDKAFWTSESKDMGRTWEPRQDLPLSEKWPEHMKLSPLFYGQGLYELPDGVWVVLLHGGPAEGNKADIHTWGSYAASCYSIRSTDQGKTWSAPLCIDGVRKPGEPRGELMGCLDLIEPVGAYTDDGRLLVYCRPIYNPTMWQAVSNDGAMTWDACSRSAFPGYAADMCRTTSGALLVSHRFPDHSINLSLDNGRTWDAGTGIDWPLEGAGKLIEVAPDVLLFIYRDDRQQHMRAQYIRVTPQGLVKLPRDW